MSWLIVILLFLISSFNSFTNDNKHSVAVVIPAYNEEENVAKVIATVKKVDYINEIIVVDDGSLDDTFNKAKNAGATVIKHEYNQGKGAALKTGFNNSKSDVVAFIDADIYNLSPKKIDSIIKPILEGKTDLTKTKFARESGRVTELTAKPLLNFFFPEVSFEQPLSGQFAGKRSILKDMDFESDYGVDVGIVLDADVKGIEIEEVDIGDIQHDLSPLKDLNNMANEVVRTIVTRAMEYGRVTMIDSLGNYIRMSILGLSLVILGLFAIFFVQPIPYQLGFIISILGLGVTIYYLVKLIIKSVSLFKKYSGNRSFIISFIKMHLPIIIVAFLLLLMISTFVAATSIGEDGKISIEATSRNIVIFPSDSTNTLTVRGPYLVATAFENESDIIRMPEGSIQTLQMSYGDFIIINGNTYIINESARGDNDIIRMPADVRNTLQIEAGNTISNSRLPSVFENSVIIHNVKNSNNSYSISENFLISSQSKNSTLFDIYVDGKYVTYTAGIIQNTSVYTISRDGSPIGYLDINDIENNNNTFTFTSDGHEIKLVVNSTTNSIKNTLDSSSGSFLNFDFVE